ncbi:MAG: glycosidase [Bacteroidia bacterium]|nr:glycoside hydrolase family 130 protein [Bacteroidales bacterium]MDY0285919.1 glycoside hydrolase family 130 protein [Bacteroidales bacterium]NCD42160.1 glycosidase [Bacteroidia bacterium]HPE57642.1 glycoside hydrolase family 130 protein [Bacteroidales bacterium]
MITRLPIRIASDKTKVIPLLFNPGNMSRVADIIHYIQTLSDEKVEEINEEIAADFAPRHYHYTAILRTHYAKILSLYQLPNTLNEPKLLFAGACFTKEYSIESAALFNPSMVPHPDQRGLDPGAVRFIMSLRATGEGHISCITFMTGIIGANGVIQLNEARRPLIYSRHYTQQDKENESAYTITFPADGLLEQQIIFPYLETERGGMEDLRLVHFNDSGEEFWAGTYTAYNGKTFTTHLLYTLDFRHFSLCPLTGKAVQDKGMALFPKKINGRYAMISRQGGRDIRIMYSESLTHWEESSFLSQPNAAWNLVQIGNCGSPIYTDKGWIMLIHGVGAFRKYTIGAILLDLNNPSIVSGTLEGPILSPSPEEREGYVPNVLYSCGGFAHHTNIIFPVALSDTSSGITFINIPELLTAFRLS